MTVMLVGLVNSGVMELGQTIGVIMGSNIGTTLTAWILSLSGIESSNTLIKLLKPENFSPVVALIGIILIMAFFRNALTAGALTVLFITFSALEGVLLGPVLSVYTTQSLGLTFACTAGMFGAMALYGAVTKRNLSGMGRTLMMLLFGLIIAGIANIFFGSNTADLIISGAGVIIFALYTAYDTQRLLAEGAWLTDEDQRTKGAIMGAVNLYLNFLNLFLYLLRFLGDRE